MATLAALRSFLDEAPHGPAVAAVRADSRSFVREPQLAELRAFCAAIESGSISGAARVLHLTQPALSKRLRGLEAVVRTKLLQRSTRGVTPTPAGARLYSAARRLLADAELVEAVMCGFADHSAPVRIASSPTIAESWLPSALVDLERRHERRLRVGVITANSTFVRQTVREGQADLGLAAVDPGHRPHAGMAEYIIWQDEIVVALPPRHPWTALTEIDREQFARTPVIAPDPAANSTRIVHAELNRIGLTQVPPLAEIGNTAAAITTALAKRVPVLLPVTAARNHHSSDLAIRRVEGVNFVREFALVLAGSLEGLAPAPRALADHLLTWRDHIPRCQTPKPGTYHPGSAHRTLTVRQFRPSRPTRPKVITQPSRAMIRHNQELPPSS